MLVRNQSALLAGLRLPQPVFAPPDDPNLGGGDQQQQQNQNQDGKQQQQQREPGALDPSAQRGGQLPGDGKPVALHRPEGLPDHLLGKDNNETIEKLFGAFSGLRKLEGDRGAVPKEAKAYKFDADEKLKPYVADFDNDPIYGGIREDALAAGMTDKQFASFLPRVLKRFVDGELVAAPVDAKAQLRSLAPDHLKDASEADKEKAATQRMKNNLAWVDGAKSQGVFPAGHDGKSPVAEFFASALASDPRAHAAIEWLRGQDAEPRPAMPGGGAGGAPDKASLKARINDPRNDPRSSKFEPSFADETDRMSREAHPG